MAEREGFEPPVPCGITGFQDQRHKPLGHLSSLLEPAKPIIEQPDDFVNPFFRLMVRILKSLRFPPQNRAISPDARLPSPPTQLDRNDRIKNFRYSFLQE